MTADEEGIHLRSLDKSHITFITLELKKSLFDTYECDIPEKIAVDCTEFHKILKKCKTNETLELSINENLNITMKGDATRKFKINFIDMEYDSPVPPQLDIPTTITIPSGLLKDYINDLADFDEKLTFMIDEDYFKIIADGQIGRGEVEYLHGENIKEFVSSHFSIPKLLDILKASKFSKECKLSVGDDMPLILRLELITGDGFLEYLLAPRLDESAN
jgi:proliferating cell nuclear antigen